MYICACSQWTGILPEQFFLLTINLLGQRYYPGLIPQPTLPTQAPTSLKKFLHQPTLHGWEAKATPSSRTPPGLQATHCFRPDQPSGQENERDVCFSSVLLHAPAARATRLKHAIQSFSVHPQSLPSTTTSNDKTFQSPQVETQPNHTCHQLLSTSPPPSLRQPFPPPPLGSCPRILCEQSRTLYALLWPVGRLARLAEWVSISFLFMAD